MLPAGQLFSPDERRLLKLFRKLPATERDTLLRFAQFLCHVDSADSPPSQPLPLPRPEKETVIGAIKRLSSTYFMLEKDKLLPEISAAVAEHVLQGRNAAEVIDRLEALFRRHYEAEHGGEATDQAGG